MLITIFVLSCTIPDNVQEFKGELERLKVNNEKMKVESCELSPSSTGCNDILRKVEEAKEVKKQEIANTEIIMPKEERKEVYLCDFTESSCDFNVAVGTSGTLLSEDPSFLSINDHGMEGIPGELVSVVKETDILFNRIEVTFDDFKKSVGYGDSIFSFSSRKWGWYNFIIYCETQTECQFITRYGGSMVFSSNSELEDKQIKIIPPPSGEFKLVFDIEEDNGFYWANVYLNDQFLYRMNKLFDGAYTAEKTKWLKFSFRNHEDTSNRFRVKKIVLYE